MERNGKKFVPLCATFDQMVLGRKLNKAKEKEADNKYIYVYEKRGRKKKENTLKRETND